MALVVSCPWLCQADPLIVLSVRVNASSDDAEQNSGGTMTLNNGTLRVGTMSWIGVRFKNITIPRYATITNAILTSRSNGSYSATPAAATIFAQDIDDSAAYTSTSNNISSRARTTANYPIPSIPSYPAFVDLPTPDISPLIQEVIDRSGWNSGNDLSLIIRSDATGLRGTYSYDGSSTYAPLITIEYTPNPRPVAPNLLFVVTSTTAPTAQELECEEWFKWWAYEVTRIAATDTQANFNIAAAANDVAFVAESITSGDLNIKLKNAALGVVTDEPAIVDDFALASTAANTGVATFSVASNTHYITSPFPTGAISLFSSTQPSTELAGTLAREALTLGAFSNGATGLITIEAGGKLSDNSTAYGRRVVLPWSSGVNYNLINSNGQTLLKRSLEWAAGLTAHYKLDATSGTIVDDSGSNNRDGTLYNTSFTSGVTAKVGTGLNLDGVNDYVSIANDPSLQLTKALTIAGWVYLDAFGVGSDVDPILRKGTASPVNYQLCIQDGKVTLHLNESEGTGAGTIGNTTLTTGRWYHVAATWDGSTANVYLDGISDRTPRSVSGTLPAGADPLYLGGRSGADLSDGKFDDVRLYNYAMTAAEVLKLKSTGQPLGVRIVKWVELQ